MDHELATLLTMLAVAVPVGLVVGVVIVLRRPQWCRSYAKFVRNRRWPIFLAGIVVFALAALFNLQGGQYYFAACSAAMFLLEVYCFFARGFKRLTPEEEARIDSSDPSRTLRTLWQRLSHHCR